MNLSQIHCLCSILHSVHQAGQSFSGYEPINGPTALPAEEMVPDKEGAGMCVIGGTNNCSPLPNRGLLRQME